MEELFIFSWGLLCYLEKVFLYCLVDRPGSDLCVRAALLLLFESVVNCVIFTVAGIDSDLSASDKQVRHRRYVTFVYIHFFSFQHA